MRGPADSEEDAGGDAGCYTLTLTLKHVCSWETHLRLVKLIDLHDPSYGYESTREPGFCHSSRHAPERSADLLCKATSATRSVGRAPGFGPSGLLQPSAWFATSVQCVPCCPMQEQLGRPGGPHQARIRLGSIQHPEFQTNTLADSAVICLLPADSLLKQLLRFALALGVMFRLWLCCIAESIMAMQFCRFYDSWLQEARTPLLTNYQTFAGNTLLSVGWALQKSPPMSASTVSCPLRSGQCHGTHKRFPKVS